jgi:hypothetical protein
MGHETRESAEASEVVRARSKILRSVGGRFGYLLLALVALMLSVPLMAEGTVWNIILALFAGAVLIAGLHAARPGRKSLSLGLLLALVDFSIGRLASFDVARWLLLLQFILWSSTLVYVTVTIFEAMYDSESVSLETLQATLCVYLLLGLIWVYLYILFDLFAPGSFVSQDGHPITWSDDPSRRSAFAKFFVFSFSTLSGSGYATVTPANGFSRMAAALESMTGQIYLAVVIARLVGISSGEGAERKG